MSEFNPDTLLDEVLNKVSTRLNTYYSIDDRSEYCNGAKSELIILKEFVNDLINKSNHPKDTAYLLWTRRILRILKWRKV